MLSDYLSFSYRKSSIKPLGGFIFSSTFEEGGGAYLIQQNASTAARFLEGGLVVTGRYTAFSNNKKMITILHRELQHKVEKLKHMKLEVMRPKTKNNMNFQPE